MKGFLRRIVTVLILMVGSALNHADSQPSAEDFQFGPQAEIMLLAGKPGPAAIRPKFNKAAGVKGKGKLSKSFNRSGSAGRAKTAFNKAAKSHRVKARRGQGKSGVRKSPQRSIRNRFTKSAQNLAGRNQGKAVKFSQSRVQSLNPLSPQKRTTPPRVLLNTIQGNKGPSLSHASPGIKGAKPPGYLARKFNHSALGANNISGTFNKAAGAGRGSSADQPLPPTLKPKGP